MKGNLLHLLCLCVSELSLSPSLTFFQAGHPISVVVRGHLLKSLLFCHQMGLGN